jgi:toxin ParE1/3/4
MKLTWSPLALERASEIIYYISLDNPSAAKRWLNTVFDKVEQLISFPELERIVPEISDYRFREIIYGNYRIIYHLDLTTISILTIRHSKQILPIDEIKL